MPKSLNSVHVFEFIHFPLCKKKKKKERRYLSKCKKVIFTYSPQIVNIEKYTETHGVNSAHPNSASKRGSAEFHLVCSLVADRFSASTGTNNT